MNVKKCSACGAPIIFIKTPAGGWMPCEKYPVAYQVNVGGPNPDTLVDSQGQTFRGKITAAGIGRRLAWLPHWRYCAGAAQVRRAAHAKKAAPAKKVPETPPATWEQTSLF